MSRDERLHLEDIVSYATDTLGFIEGLSRDQVIGERRTYFAVLHALTVIGEAAKKIAPEVRARAPDIPWRRIAGFRDRLVHAYREIDPDVIWQIVTHELEPLREEAAALLAELDREAD